jgi:hypothetical protein
MRNNISLAMTSGATSTVLSNNGPRTVAGFQLPAMDGATIGFERRADAASSWATVRDVASATAYSIPIGSAGYVPVDQRVFAGGGDIRLIANTLQTADRTIVAALNDAG